MTLPIRLIPRRLQHRLHLEKDREVSDLKMKSLSGKRFAIPIRCRCRFRCSCSCEKNAPTEGRYTEGMRLNVKPFGIEARRVRCLRCGTLGHQTGDRECPRRDANPNDAQRAIWEDPLTLMRGAGGAADPPPIRSGERGSVVVGSSHSGGRLVLTGAARYAAGSGHSFSVRITTCAFRWMSL
jgi:hypothetical protein